MLQNAFMTNITCSKTFFKKFSEISSLDVYGLSLISDMVTQRSFFILQFLHVAIVIVLHVANSLHFNNIDVLLLGKNNLP